MPRQVLARANVARWHDIKAAHCPSPVPSPRAAKAILVHKARGEGQGGVRVRGHAPFYATLGCSYSKFSTRIMAGGAFTTDRERIFANALVIAAFVAS